MVKIILLGAIAVAAGVIVYGFQPENTVPATVKQSIVPTASPISIPASYEMPIQHHTFQTFNNCGPASLSMALSYYGLRVSQQEIGNDLRPYQNPQGDNDDKSTTLEELARKGEEYGFVAYHRPGGTIEMMKRFIANDMPVITRTWLEPNNDIGHYRVVRGYTSTELIQDDSLQGKDLRYSYDDFNAVWNKFNYEYLVLVPEDKVNIAKQILGENVDEKEAWKNAVELSRAQLDDNPDDRDARFNVSVALYHSGDFQGSVEEYEKVASSLPFRTLWYQIEPIQAYYELQEYDTVLQMTEQILNNQNRAFSELYIIRGDVYRAQGNRVQARQEYEKAVQYNANLQSAKEALASVQ